MSDSPPVWAGSPTFRHAWAASWNLDHVRRQLADAHVLVFEREQIDVLPGRPPLDMVEDILAHERLPFDPVYIDLGGLPHGAPTVFGVLLCETARGVHAGSLFFQNSNGRFVKTEENGGGWVANTGLNYEGQKMLTVDGRHVYSIDDPIVVDHPESFEEGTRLARDTAACLLQFLSSYNVDLGPAPMSRQEARQAARKGHSIAQTCVIRPPKSRRSSAGSGQERNFSHRFEVRGHYKHFPAGTRLADAAPEKLSWSPERQEYVRRLWCPPFVVGPETKPFVPKTRIIRESD